MVEQVRVRHEREAVRLLEADPAREEHHLSRGEGEGEG